jgi:hypothetical protein
MLMCTIGARPLGITTLSIATISIMPLSKMPLSTTTLGIKEHSATLKNATHSLT